MKSWIKKTLLVTFLAILPIGLSGCKNKESAEKDGQVTIEYFNQKKEMSETLKEIAADFEKDNPDIHVEVVDVPNAGEVIKTRMLAGDVPDVINLYPQSIELQEWAKAGYLEDLTDKDYLKNIKNNYAQRFAVNDHVYNVPLSANVYGFYYNKTAFDEMGLKAPTTWKEFEEVIDKIVENNETPIAVAGSEGWTLNGYHQLAISTVAGGEEEANNVWRFSKVDGISENDSVMKDDFNRLDILRKPGVLQKNWQGAGYNDALISFTKGDALMTANGSWALPIINQQNPEFEVATFPFPSENPDESLTIGAGDLALSISSRSTHKEEANRFVEYMTQPEVMQKYYDVDGSPCAVEGVVENTDNSPLKGLTDLAFTDRHLVWLAKDWTSENDFYTLTINYLQTGNKKSMIDSLNAFFNPMKATGR